LGLSILRSISRTLPGCNSAEENALVSQARQFLATYEDMAELIRLGAYRKGSDPKVDEAIKYYPAIEKFLSQAREERAEMQSGYVELQRILGAPKA